MSEQLKYSIIDIETTGGSARANKITEIAVINVDGNQIVDTFSSLIFPERSIPPQIQALTGITDQMVADAPKFYELAKKIVEMTEGRIFVAHNVHFDYSFIQNEFRDLGYTFKRDLLCTVRLARKILPGHPSYSLGKLCAGLGIELENRHRAMGDAMATAKLFQLIQEQNSENFQEIFNGLNNKLNFPPHFQEIDYENLPMVPGVYYLWDKQGELLYIGKAKEIKKRVRQHFSVKSTRTKEFQFKNNIATITYKETGNELAALLFEAHEIKKRSPLFNRALRRKRFPFTIASSLDEAGVLQFRVLKLGDEESELGCGSKKSAQGLIKKIYQKAFGLDPSIELGRSQELELLLKTLGPKLYNQRLEKAHQELRYPEREFQIRLKGRTESESCVVRRMADAQLDILYLDGDQEVERFSLEENPDLAKIILQYLKKRDIKVEVLVG